MTLPAIGVCGHGRCGSTMAMAMVKAGGIQFVDGSDPDTGELTRLDLDDLGRLPLEGRAVKLLDWVLYGDLPPADWRFIWLDRDPVQQARSTAKFLAGIEGIDVDEATLAASYERDRPVALGRLRALGPVLVLEYERVLAQPQRAARQLARHVAGMDNPLAVAHPTAMRLDVRAAGAAVHRRDGRCRPDLAFELSCVGGAADGA